MPENIFTKIFQPKGKGKLWWVFAIVMALTLGALLVDFGGVYNKAVKSYGLKLPTVPDVRFKLGLDLIGGSQLTYKADVSAVPGNDRDAAVEGARDVIERRVNSFGVSEPLVQVNRGANGEYRIIVELAGIGDINEAIKKIGETPLLEFKEQAAADQKQSDEEKKALDDFNKQAQNKAADSLGKLMKGGDFGAIAKAVSEDKATADKGGDMGWISSADSSFLLNQPILDAAAKLKKGQMANDLVKNSEGYNIIKLNDKRTKKAADGQDAVEVQARHILICYEGAQDCTSGLKKEDALAKIQKIKAQANVKNFKDLVKMNSTEPKAKDTLGELGWFGQGKMVPEFDKAVFAQKVGTISDVVETPFGYHLIWKEAERKVTEYDVSRILAATKAPVPTEEWQNTKLTGSNLKRAAVQFNPNNNMPEVSLEFNDEGAKLFEEITARNVGKPVAIFLDGYPISIPNVNEKITGGKAVISGKFNTTEAKDLAKRLNAGALPLPIELINQQTVGATLGDAAVRSSLQAGLIGLLLVALFMIIFYRLPGLLSVASLMIYGLIVLAIFKLWPVTLTLPGIAGFIMSIGIAVDANILIFERMKEELRAGRTLTRGLEEGFTRAWPSIRDGNVSTIITTIVLMLFSTSIIKGFAVTLFLGVLVSLFTAIVVTRNFLKLIDEKVLEKHSWLICRIKK